MGKIAEGVNKINFTMLYGNYCYIIIENFPQKFSPCMQLYITEQTVKRIVQRPTLWILYPCASRWETLIHHQPFDSPMVPSPKSNTWNALRKRPVRSSSRYSAHCKSNIIPIRLSWVVSDQRHFFRLITQNLCTPKIPIPTLKDNLAWEVSRSSLRWVWNDPR